MTREEVEKNKIYEIRVGSHLYGTNIETSDEDFTGVFLPTDDYIFGLKSIGQVDLGIHSKLKDGKNAPDALDKVFYEFRKYISLLMQNNPNIMETIYVNDENIIFISDTGKQMIDFRDNFLNLTAVNKFLGYATSQKRKMFIKKENREMLLESYEFLTKHFDKDDKKLLIEHKSEIEKSFMKFRKDNVKIGDLSFSKTITIKKAIGQLKERIDKMGHRTILYDEFGYDVKFGMNIIRLLFELEQLLVYGELHFPLDIAELLKDIRKGKFDIVELNDMVEKRENRIKELEMTSTLRKKPDFNKINNFVVNVLKQYSLGRYD